MAVAAGNKKYIKVVDEHYVAPEENGGGLIKFEIWELYGKMVKYSMAYINKSISFTHFRSRLFWVRLMVNEQN